MMLLGSCLYVMAPGMRGRGRFFVRTMAGAERG